MANEIGKVATGEREAHRQARSPQLPRGSWSRRCTRPTVSACVWQALHTPAETDAARAALPVAPPAGPGGADVPAGFKSNKPDVARLRPGKAGDPVPLAAPTAAGLEDDSCAHVARASRVPSGRLLLRDIAAVLRHTLRGAGYDLRYYGTPRGFAVAARLERIDDQGNPYPQAFHPLATSL